VIPHTLAGSSAHAYVSGSNAAFTDIGHRIFSHAPWFLLYIIGITFLLLAMAFRSAVIAFKAALTTLLSALVAMENGLQVAFMAPTEILAEQHFTNISRLLQASRFRVALLTGSTAKAARREQLAQVEHQVVGVEVLVAQRRRHDVREEILVRVQQLQKEREIAWRGEPLPRPLRQRR